MRLEGNRPCFELVDHLEVSKSIMREPTQRERRRAAMENKVLILVGHDIPPTTLSFPFLDYVITLLDPSFWAAVLCTPAKVVLGKGALRLH